MIAFVSVGIGHRSERAGPHASTVFFPSLPFDWIFVVAVVAVVVVVVVGCQP